MIGASGLNLIGSGALASLVLLGAAAQAVAAQKETVDPQAAAIAIKSAEYLASRPAFSFGWFVSYDEVVEEKEKISYLRSGTTRMVRNSGFVMQTERGDTFRDYYWDGSTITVASPNENWHASADYTGNFEALVETIRKTTGTVVPMWSILSKDLPRDLLKNADAGAYLGKTLVAGQEAHHLAFSEKEEDWQIWVSTSETSPVPLMLIGTEKAKTGWPQYRVYMTDWNVDLDQDSVQFKYVPGENSLEITLPLLSDISEDAQKN
jgi:hypothetical protein